MDPDGADYNSFFILFTKDQVKVAISTPVKEEEEYMYTYLPFATNEKLLFSYGFYFVNNSLSTAGFETAVQKQLFTKEKWEVCKKVGCLDNNYDAFYQDKNAQQAPAKVNLFPHKISQKYLDMLRIYVEPVKTFNATLFEKRLLKKKWISYANEMTALILHNFVVSRSETMSKMNTVYYILKFSLIFSTLSNSLVIFTGKTEKTSSVTTT
jgi:hypothetical protein